jgi:hypothetical protein
MVYSGHVRDGVIVLDVPVVLPDGAAVSVELVDAASGETQPDESTLLQRLQSVVGTARNLPEDAASNLDAYLYGPPQS